MPYIVQPDADGLRRLEVFAGWAGDKVSKLDLDRCNQSGVSVGVGLTR